ncbi:DUF3035 domain-containing protein [Roseiterribacter gracilis]|uniref:Lipoprotein n=1 Tax=Roseiterribacter gracilis TaxID=2812848 RepID=A0A8S8XIA2_9PROT|nr:hypothetical protein TMPK1_32330 [Rhodospirillales bacterium TMPK1]
MTTKAIALAALSAATLMTSGCDTFRSALGMQRSVPDETQVTLNRPLVMPPDYSLRPPASATESVSGTRVTSFTAGSRADTLLQSSQTQDGKPIGTTATTASSSTTTTKKEERGFFGRLMNSWFGSGKDEETERAEREAKQQSK